MSMLNDLFGRYEVLAKKADFLFKTIQKQYPACVRCRIHCCDCCHAIFGVFPIEAAYINYYFNRLERKVKRDVLRRAEKAEDQMLKVKDRLHVFDDDPRQKVYGLGKQRIRCPFLNEKEECVFYEKRPIICRIYGVPFTMKDGNKEKVYVCGFSGFLKSVNYPTVKLNDMYHQLCQFSKELLTKSNAAHPERAALMLPLSRVLKIPLESIIKGDFAE
jgi:Fe-S-cluster containining protein